MITVQENHFIVHRRRGFTVTIMEDEDGRTPYDDEVKNVLSPEDVAGWELGQWRFITVLVNATDEKQEYLQAGDIDVFTGSAGHRSDADLSNVIGDMCDELCDTLDRARISCSHPGGLRAPSTPKHALGYEP